MVVTCEKCQTKFLLDEAQITRARIQARCSRCQHVFWVEREEEPPTKAPPEDAGAVAWKTAVDSKSLEGLEDVFPLEEIEGALDPEMEAAKAALPKPSIMFTAPARRSSWVWIIVLIFAILGGSLAGGLVMWYGGYGWVAEYFQDKGRAPAPPPKVTDTGKLVTLPPPPEPPAVSGDLQDLQLISQEERYRGLVNIKGGQLLLIQGKVKNASSQYRGPVKIKAMLTDPQQKIVKEREFYAGTVIFDDELKSLDPEEINRWLNTPGGRAQKRILDPGESQSFMVVFFEAPKNLTGYGYKMQVVKGPVVRKPSGGQ